MAKGNDYAFIFDLDGTVYLGGQALPGAVETLQWVRESGAQVRFVTNNPRFSRDFYANKLTKMGIPTTTDEMVTSAHLTAEYLKKHPEFGSIYIIGEDQLRQELHDVGIIPVDHAEADTVVVSFDTTLTYDKLMKGYQALKNGARFIATNPDPVCPSPDGGLVDAGAIIAALEVSTGRTIEQVIGKPSRLLAKLLSDQFQIPPERCIVVGDRLNTDVRMGKDAGMIAVWINPSGEPCPDPNLKPDFTIRSIADLPSVLPLPKVKLQK